MGAVFKRTLISVAAALAGACLCMAEAAAQEAVSCLNSAPFDLGILPPNTRAAVEQARDAQVRAREAATLARAGTAGVVYDYVPDGPQWAGYLYEGQWSDGTRNGYGHFAASPPSEWAGTSYDGAWANGQYNGSGVMIYRNGDRYEGTWANGNKAGYGATWDLAGRLLYAGIWTDGAGALMDACEASRR